eukprot:gene4567-4612_t
MTLDVLTPSLVNAAQNVVDKGIVVMGDSLAAEYGLPRDTGWVKLLDREINQSGENAGIHFTIHNASISGETTSGGIKRLPEQLAQYKPYLVIIELGANDALLGLKCSCLACKYRRTMVKTTVENSNNFFKILVEKQDAQRLHFF